MFDPLFWLIGAAFCALGGLALLVIVLGLLIEKAASRFTNVRAVARILTYARRNGLDLATGKPVEPDIPA